MTTTAYISIVNFGDAAQIEELVTHFNDDTAFNAIENDSVVTLSMDVSRVGEFALAVSADEKLHWIEYKVQFEI